MSAETIIERLEALMNEVKDLKFAIQLSRDGLFSALNHTERRVAIISNEFNALNHTERRAAIISNELGGIIEALKEDDE